MLEDDYDSEFIFEGKETIDPANWREHEQQRKKYMTKLSKEERRAARPKFPLTGTQSNSLITKPDFLDRLEAREMRSDSPDTKERIGRPIEVEESDPNTPYTTEELAKRLALFNLTDGPESTAPFDVFVPMPTNSQGASFMEMLSRKEDRKGFVTEDELTGDEIPLPEEIVEEMEQDYNDIVFEAHERGGVPWAPNYDGEVFVGETLDQAKAFMGSWTRRRDIPDHQLREAAAGRYKIPVDPSGPGHVEDYSDHAIQMGTRVPQQDLVRAVRTHPHPEGKDEPYDERDRRRTRLEEIMELFNEKKKKRNQLFKNPIGQPGVPVGGVPNPFEEGPLTKEMRRLRELGLELLRVMEIPKYDNQGDYAARGKKKYAQIPRNTPISKKLRENLEMDESPNISRF